MKAKNFFLFLTAVFGLVATHLCSAQGTAFTYEGQLADGTGPANGLYDLRLLLYDASTGGTLLAGPVTNSAVVVSNGLFTALIDFGPGVFSGGSNWLHLGVRTNGASAFTPLSPRQQLTPTPYAIFAESANASGINGTLPSADFGGTYGNAVNLNNPGNLFAGNGAGLVNVNATSLGGFTANNFWQTTGNTGTVAGLNFVGTADSQPLEFHVNGSRGLRLDYIGLEFGSPPFFFFDYGINVNGGFWNNTISNGIIGATIAGGGYHGGLIFSGTDFPNIVNGSFGSIGGGYANTAGYAATVPGGFLNIANGQGSFAAGRYAQTAANGNFVWSDGSRNPFNGSGVNCFDVLASGGVQFYSGAAGVNVDFLNGNNGDINYALRFGVGSGEGIGSKRTSGGNQYGLDFYTSFANRMSIANYGYVGIGTTTPSQQLEVNGEFIMVDGLGGVRCYLGDDGAGGDVQIGSLTSGITAVACYNAADNAYMHLYCSSITIEGGADLAEPFQISPAEKDVAQGSVVVIDDQNPGRLKLSDRPYDTRVAGVVSGANGINPGIQMQQQGLLEGGKNVALTGRVYVLADAGNGPIRPGDLLTSSSIAGRAMKVTDHARAAGAILGKAMTGLNQGEGTVLVLVALQ